MSQNKQEIITFKVDEALANIIRRLPNRSDFIRKAILNAIDNTCPLCQGSGIITAEQRPHWEAFLETHHIEQCDECRAVFIACDEEEDGQAQGSAEPHSGG